ncbi:MAG TPA: hypothetical protein PKA64_19520 [Myxococcota bacterium]|nr:hypothetical protein [Myxococcota bacterium]
MLLPQSIRDALINDLEEYLGALPDDPDPEMVTAFMIEQLETYADEKGIDDIIVSLEESGSLDSTLQETLESEMSSNDDFEFTEEECVSLLESICDIEWMEEDDDDGDDADLDDEEEDEDEEDGEAGEA